MPDISQWSTTFEPSSNPSSNPVKNVKEELLIDSDSSEDEVFDDGDGEPVEKVIKKGKCFLTMKK